MQRFRKFLSGAIPQIRSARIASLSALSVFFSAIFAIKSFWFFAQALIKKRYEVKPGTNRGGEPSSATIAPLSALGVFFSAIFAVKSFWFFAQAFDKEKI